MRSLFRLVAATLGFLAIAVQYGLGVLGPKGATLADWTVNYFSYFTILTNVVAAIAMLLPVIAPGTWAGRLLARPSSRTIIACHIIIVGAVYILLLRNTWEPKGWQLIADRVLHYVTPVLFVIDWLLFVPKGEVPWRTLSSSLILPGVYLVWTLVHGAVAGWYPYPFIDAAKLGYLKVIANMAGLSCAFVVVTLLLVLADRWIAAHRLRAHRAS